MDEQPHCINCKYRDGIRCKRHQLILGSRELREIICDDYVPDLLQTLHDFDEQIRIAEIERR